MTPMSSTQSIGAQPVRSQVGIAAAWPSRAAARDLWARIHAWAVSIIAVIAAVVLAPTAHAEDTVTYEVSSEVVPVATGIEYRDVSGKKLLQAVPLPWHITVPVENATSPEDLGAEVRADWRPNFRTAATVGRVLQGQLVTVRISLRGTVICESTDDIGNATCYGSVPHSPDTDSSYDHSPLFPEPASGLPPP